MEQTINQSGQETFVWHKDGYLVYGFIVFLILTFGFVGNVLTLLVLHQSEHRGRSVTPLMINLALADIFIIVFGYPIAIHANLRGELLDKSHCVWAGFVNGTVGIASIFTLTEMVVVTYNGLKQINTTARLSRRQVICLIGSAWLYGDLCMLPPLLGWNRFVLAASKVSCCPDWAGKSASDTAYNLLLVVLGFFLPLTVMIVCYYKIYSLVHQVVVPGNVAIQIRQRNSGLKIVRMTAMSVIAFVLSWSPYCFVSLVAVFTGNHVIASGEAVIYNPVVYTVMNSRFRATLFHILHVRRRRTPVRGLTFQPRGQHCFRNGEDCHTNAERYQGQILLQVPSLQTRVLRRSIAGNVYREPNKVT